MDVIVGAEEVCFTVSENLLCASSEFFQKAMSKNWNGSTTRQVRLKFIEPDTFHIYVNWLYCKTLPVRIDSPGALGNAEYLELAKAYALGDLVLNERFKNAVINAFTEKQSSVATDGRYWGPVGPVIRHIYENSGANSKARTLLVDMYTMCGMGDWIEKWAVPEDLPWEFLRDLAVALLNRREFDGVKEPINPCRYHEHEESEVCSSSCFQHWMS